MPEPIKHEMNPEVTIDHSGMVLPDVTVDRVEESTLVGEYELISEIARGGMGVVYRAKQQSLDREVALKLILSGDEASTSEIDRFMVEARASARLDHPYIVPIYDIGYFEGRPFFSMGFVNGPSLSARLSKSGPIAPIEAAQIMSKVALAIEYAHRQGIIHRDLKPGNILLESSGDPKVTDFGLAKRLDSGESITATGQVLGTPSYMAPEQASGAEVGPAADIYSLGATLYAMLTGRPPFQAPSIHEMLLKLIEETPATPSSLNPGIPQTLDQICLKCLEKAPGDRYPSAKALAEDLERFLRGERLTPAKPKSKAKIFVGIGIAATVLIGLGIYFSVGNEPKVDTASVAPPPVEVEKPKVDPLAGLTESERLLVQSLESALDAGLPDLKGDPWEYRHEETAKQFEKVFKDYGWDVLSAEPEVLAAKLKGKPAVLKESILEGLERWEMSAIASKQTTIETLRNLQMQLDAADWRKTMRLLRGDGLNQAWLDQLQVVIEKEQLTPQQIEGMGYQVWLVSPTRGEPLIAIMRKLREKSSSLFWLSTALVSELMMTGQAIAAKKISYGNEAVSLLKQLELEKSKSAIIQKQIAAAFLSIGNTKAAEEATAKVEELSYPEAFKHLQHARQLRKENKIPEAVAEAQQAVLKGNDWPVAHATLGIIQRSGGQTEPSEAAFKKAIELCDTEAAAIDLMRKVFTWDAGKQPIRNRLQEMFARDRLEAEVLRRVVKYWPEVSYETLVLLREKLHFPDQVHEHIEVSEAMTKAAKTGTQKQYACVRFASSLLRAGRPINVAKPLLIEAIKLSPNENELLKFAAILALQEGRFDDAIAYYTKIYAEEKSQRHRSFYPGSLSIALAEINQIEGGLKVYREFASLWPDDPSPWIMIGLLLSRHGEEKSAEIAYTKARSRIKLFTPNPDVLSSEFLQAGRLVDSLRTAMMQCDWTPFGPWGLSSVGNGLALEGDLQSSATMAQNAYTNMFTLLQKDQTFVETSKTIQPLLMASRALGRIRIQEGRYQDALEILKFVYDANPYETIVWNEYHSYVEGYVSDYANALLFSGNIVEAEKVAKQAIEFRPGQAIARRVHGQVLLAKGQLSVAIAEFKLAAKLNPLDGLSEFHLGKALLANGELDRAVEAFEKSIRAYHRRWIRDFAPIPFDSAVSLLNALNQKSVEIIPADKRLLLQQKAIDWVKADLAEWRKKAEGNVNFEYSAAASVLDRLLKNESIKDTKILASLPIELKKQWVAVWVEAEIIRQIAEPKRAKLPKDPIEWLWPSSREHEVAEWVLGKGGSLKIASWPDIVSRESGKSDIVSQVVVRPNQKLPDRRFRITGASLSNCDITDSDIQHLRGLLELSELYLDGTAITDSGLIDLVKAAPLLGTISIERTKVTDLGLEAILHLKKVYARRSSVSDAGVKLAVQQNPDLSILHESMVLGNEALLRPTLRFNGVSSWIDLPLKLDIRKPMTLEATILLEPELHTNCYLIQAGSSVRGGGGLGLAAGNHQLFGVSSSPGSNGVGYTNQAVASNSLPILSPTRVSLVYDLHEIRIYLEGQLVGKKQGGFEFKNQEFTVRIGSAVWSLDQYFLGSIGEVRISESARYTKDYKPVERFEPDADTIGLYHLDEAEGDIAKDSSGKNNHGKIINGKWIREGKAK
jgi:serine/threonine protein kinase/tetratricopeptide (TPR) repeat protein